MALFNYLRRKKELSLLILALLLLILFSSARIYFPKLSLVGIVRFPAYVASFVIREIKTIVFYRGNFYANIRLKKENALLAQELLALDEVSRQNERLSKLLGFKKKSKLSLIGARVIARDSANWKNSLIISKGKNQGIKQGQAVITESGLVGKVVEVSRNTSRVLLITDPDSNIAGIIQRSRETGIISGSLLGKCVMRYLAADADIQDGDVVLTFGAPKGIIIGEVISWHRERDGVSYSAILRPEVRLSVLEEVLVVE